VALLLTRSGKVELARSFHRDIQNLNDQVYFTIGRTTPWDDEQIPENSIDSNYYLNEFRRNIMFVQKITSANICHLARRIDWTSGTVYDPYDDSYSEDNLAESGATNLADANFYVLTNDFNVYKCLDNNNGALSTTKPEGTAPTIIEHDGVGQDGYIWKFLFQLSPADRTKFLDSNFIPVRKLTGNPTFDVNGIIDTITVTSGGSGYSTSPAIQVGIDGDGIGAGATAVLGSGGTAGQIVSVTVTNPGSGYSFADVTFTGGGGSGATASATLGVADALPSLQSAVESASTTQGGTIGRIIISNGGENYISGAVTVVITGDGSGATATATVVDGEITNITVTNEGSGYTFADVTFSSATGTLAVARAVISPIEGHGSNPTRELYASRIGIVSTLFDKDNADLTLGNDFRQIGLVKNLKDYPKTSNFTSSTGNASFIVDVATGAAGNYAVDDIILTNDAVQGKFRVTQKINNVSSYKIHLQKIRGNITSSSTLTNETQTLSGLSINSLANPEFNVTSGEIVYIENRVAVNRNENQAETIKAIVTF
jgi:hypothetical protein